MYDRQVRRRRAVLAGLVALSIVLLTAYFGESASGGLHSVQRGAMQVLGPVQEGASRALKPFRDLFGWVGDTVDAKQERDELVAERDKLEKEVTALQVMREENEQLRSLLEINQAQALDRYDPVRARIVARSPNLLDSAVTIDKGSSAGISVDDPVVNGQGLVGRVSEVTRGYSRVTLLTDEAFAVAARTVSPDRSRGGQPGTVESEVGGGDLRLILVQAPEEIRKGDRIVTAGSLSPRLESYFPPGIPIGRVSRVDVGDGDLDRTIHVRPSADLPEMLWVQVLTKQNLPQATASTTP